MAIFLQCEELNGEIYQATYPDNSLRIKAPRVNSSKLPIIFVWNYENDAELFTLICLAKKYKNQRKILQMLYLPHARMDREQEESDVFTLKYFCEVINSLEFDKVIIKDPHSNVGPALLNNVKVLDIIFDLEKILSKDEEGWILCFPDAGAAKKYDYVAKYFNKADIIICDKQRDWSTGKILGLEVRGIKAWENKEDKKILIVDDICSYGGTIYYTTQKLLELGFKNIYAFTTHCEKSIFNKEKSKINPNMGLKRFFTANYLGNIEEDNCWNKKFFKEIYSGYEN